MFEHAGQILFEQMQQVGYWGVLLATFAENIIPPIPSELIMPFAGFMASQGTLNIITVILVAGLGSTLGTMPYYFIGRIFHKAKIIRRTERYGKYIFMKKQGMEEIFKTFEKNDKKIVFFGRFVPGARGLISLPAGSAKMHFGQFMLYTFTGTCIRSAVLCTIGYVLGQNRQQVVNFLSYYDTIAIIAVALIIVGIILKKVIRKTAHIKE